MKMNFDLAFKIIVILLLSFIATFLVIMKIEMNDSQKEIDMVISKLDYVESDINSAK